MKNPFLIGTRLYFRALERDDAPIVSGWLNDPEVRIFLRRVHPLNLQTEIDFIDSVAKDQSSLGMMMVLRESDRPIGVAGLHNVDLRNRKAEFGISIGEKDCWSQGYGVEATKLILGHAFGTLNMHRIVLFVYAYNERGIRCYEKVGFRKEGTLRQDQYHEGRYWDTIVMAMLRDEWQALRDATR